MTNLKNVLITGGAGFIGSNVALYLVDKGYNVSVLDSLSSQIHGERPFESSLLKLIEGKVNFCRTDVTKQEIWKSAIEGIDVIIHFAAETGTGQSMYEIEKYVNTNVRGTALMWDALTNQKHNVKKVVVASSRAIYGEGKYRCPVHGIVYPHSRVDEDMAKGDFSVKCPICRKTAEVLPTTEDSALASTSIYGFTKRAQEEMSLIAGQAIKLPVVAFRYQNVYGPGQSLSNPYTGILSIFSTRILNGNDIQIYEDGKESRDFVYIDDVVKATVLGLEKPEANYQVFNVGTGLPTNVVTVANTLKSEFDSGVEVKITGHYRLGDIRNNFADLTKINKYLGFKPEVDFSEGIKRFVGWVKTQKIANDGYESAIKEMKERGLFKV